MLPYRLPPAIRMGLYALAVATLLYLCLAPSGNPPKPYLAPSPGLQSISLWDKDRRRTLERAARTCQ